MEIDIPRHCCTDQLPARRDIPMVSIPSPCMNIIFKSLSARVLKTILHLTLNEIYVSLFLLHNMRPVTLTRGARLNCLKPRALNGSSRRYLTMLSPPKFENEKMVSDTKVSMDITGLWLTANQLNYAKGSPERAELTKTIKKLKGQFPFTIPITINGSEVCSQNNHSQLRIFH